MLMSKKLKPELIVSKDEIRVNMTAVHLDTEIKRLIATDGHMLVSVPIETQEHDTTGPVPVEAFKRARTLATKSDPEVQIQANGSIVMRDGGTMPREDVGKFPDFNQVMPSFGPYEAGTMTVSFNPALLMELVKAIGIEKTCGIRLTFKVDSSLPTSGDLGPLLIESNDSNNKAIGVLMPMRDEKRPTRK